MNAAFLPRSLLLVLAIATSPVLSQDFESGPGSILILSEEAATAGDFDLAGTVITEEDAAMAGGDFVLSGGVALVFTEDNLAAHRIAVRQERPDLVLSWDDPAGIFDLECSPTLGDPGAWEVLAGARSTTNGIVSVRWLGGAGSRFFRLHLR